MFAGLALVAVAIEAAVGYPEPLYRAIGHPVTWIGRLIAWADDAWNSPTTSFERRRGMGVVLLLLLLGAGIAAGAFVADLLDDIFGDLFGTLFCGLLASSLLAQRSLAAHVGDVATGLDEHELAGGRNMVARIVGRDTEALDEAGICRAAIESLAENFSDGVVAPLFWMVVAGLPGALAYKAVNTADFHDRPQIRPLPSVRLGLRTLRRSGEPAGLAADGALVDRGGGVAAGLLAGECDSRSASRFPSSPFAQCRLAGSGHGGRARHPARRAARL